ncbi:hypothetical protein V7S79_05540 [Aquirufa sp. ROCK-SH2]
MKIIKILGLICFLSSTLNLFGATKINEKRTCLVTSLGVNNCGNMQIVKTSASTYGNASQEELCRKARELGMAVINAPCASTRNPPTLNI